MYQRKVLEKIETHILCPTTFPRKSYILWDNVEKYGRTSKATDENIIRRMRFACSITKATNTNTHTEYVVLFAFPQQELLSERASLLNSYVNCLSCRVMMQREQVRMSVRCAWQRHLHSITFLYPITAAHVVSTPLSPCRLVLTSNVCAANCFNQCGTAYQSV